MKIIGGLIFIVIGTLVVMYTEWLLKNFGRINWFEKHLGAEGGSRMGYKLVGLVIIFIGLLMTTGMVDGFFNFMLSPLTRGRV
jgi:polyferredoxin